VHAIPAWYRNIGKRLIKSPKLILTDSGLLTQLLGGGNGVDRLFGPALENFVLIEIVKQASVSDARPSVFHYRTAGGVEVDAVIEPRGGPLCAVEVKAAATLTARDSHGLRSLATALGDDFGTGVILHTGHEAARLAPKIWALPMSVLWAPL
jgi:predicted AAA+ superfamily ATPase